ncbi:MAG: hypothetical protein LBM62_00715 [Mediterranea sp.]|nr:hypothetical protein [Mediterranea sp.]
MDIVGWCFLVLQQLRVTVRRWSYDRPTLVVRSSDVGRTVVRRTSDGKRGCVSGYYHAV